MKRGLLFVKAWSAEKEPFPSKVYYSAGYKGKCLGKSISNLCVGASWAPALAISPPPSWRKMAKCLIFWRFCDFLPAGLPSNKPWHVRTWHARTRHVRTYLNMDTGYTCSIAIHAIEYVPWPLWCLQGPCSRVFGGLENDETRPFITSPMIRMCGKNP